MKNAFGVVVMACVAHIAAGQSFVDRTKSLGIELGTGAASWGDVNADGWIDLFCDGALWINHEGKSFSRVALPGAGSGMVADIDNDCRGDIISFAPLAIFRNVRDGSPGVPEFERIALPELPESVCRGASVGDFNGDGWCDIYLGGYEDWDRKITYPSLLLLSEQGKGFALGMQNADYRARGVTACDFDENGSLDIYVSNYRLQPNVLWVNDGKGHLTNQAAARNAIATSSAFGGGHSIGACFGDFDGDGHFDLFAGNFAHVDSRGDQPKSRFLRNLGAQPADASKAWTFEDLGECGVWYQESYASPACGDYDNDGRLDLYFTTVYATASFKKKNYPVLYRNSAERGGAWTFSDVTAGSGLGEQAPTYQAAWGDFDRNGTLDLVTAGKLFANLGSVGHWCEVRLIGDGVKACRDAIGTQVRISMSDGRVLSRQVEIGTGEGNSNSPILHFGLGEIAADATLKMQIRWTDGKQEERDVQINTMMTIEQGK